MSDSVSGCLPTRVSGRGRGWYRGDCHVHSVYSDGTLTPEQLTVGARAAGLDFLATTEHNNTDVHGAWRLAGDDLLVILGEEVTTKTGHWLALGIDPGELIDWRYGVRDKIVDKHLARVHRAGGLCVAAHPHAPYASGTSFMYPYAGFDVVEVWNGLWASDLPWNADNEAALAEWGRGLAADILTGHWRPAMGSSDTHLDEQIGIPHTVVLAEELSVEAILAGIGAGRSWIAESAAVDLSFTVSADDRDAGIGELLKVGDEPAAVQVQVRGVPGGAVSFHTEQGRAHRAPLPGDGSGTVEWRTCAAESSFVRIEVRHPDGRMAAMSNPIILN